MFQTIVPVTIKSSSGKCIAAYTFRDNSSASSFITEELQQKLNPQSVRTSLRLSTMNGADALQSCLIGDLEWLKFVLICCFFKKKKNYLYTHAFYNTDKFESRAVATKQVCTCIDVSTGHTPEKTALKIKKINK